MASNLSSAQILKIDEGAVNARILARQSKVDYRRVEAASVKVLARLTSAEGKRMFVRFFSTLQLNAHFISVVARTRLTSDDVARIEATIRARIDAASHALGEAIDGADALMRNNGITHAATYDTQALEIEVGVISSTGRRYLELIGKLDQLMPLLQTLEIHEVITTQALDAQRAALKRQVRDVANNARGLATGVRRRMNALAADEAASARPRDREQEAQGEQGAHEAMGEEIAALEAASPQALLSPAGESVAEETALSLEPEASPQQPATR